MRSNHFLVIRVGGNRFVFRFYQVPSACFPFNISLFLCAHIQRNINTLLNIVSTIEGMKLFRIYGFHRKIKLEHLFHFAINRMHLIFVSNYAYNINSFYL